MNRTIRLAVAGALSATVALGVTAPAASAAPKNKPAHVKVTKAKPTKTAPAGKSVRASKIQTALLRQAAEIEATVAANEPLVVDNAAAAQANAEAAVAVAAAVAKAALLTPLSTKADYAAVRADLHTARVAIEAVEAALAAPVGPVEEPVTTEPVTTEPAPVEPTV